MQSIQQRSQGDCWFMATLASVAHAAKPVLESALGNNKCAEKGTDQAMIAV